MILPDDVLHKIDNLAKAARQSNAARNNGEVFVREVLKRAKDAKLTDSVPPEQIEGLAAADWLLQLVRSKADFPQNIMEIASQRRNHKLMMKLLRHPDDTVRTYAADQFQITFAMLDGYYDEASSLVNQVLLLPTEIPAVKSALLGDMGRSSRRGLPREIGDVARRLINDIEPVISYHALRLLTTLYDVRDWKSVLDRMVSMMGEEDEQSEYFLAAGVEYLQNIAQYEPPVVEWMKSLIETYGRNPNHLAMKALNTFVRRNADVALDSGLIDKRAYKELTGVER
ncbi:MAG TPA: hypothetical protein VKQ72_02925 [Aggregatilineales bacterium]|nr:hypothetical protein [Aggregatilineales bacterium]